MRFRKLTWKCAICGMTDRREPHRRLSDHMEVIHGQVWCEKLQKYVAKKVENQNRLRPDISDGNRREMKLSDIVERLKKLQRKDVGEFDEGGGNMCHYADESTFGRWVEWDDIQKLIDECQT